jgi:hypothetical protein
MADNVKFKEWQSHDDRPGIDQENSISRTLAFAGIHDRTFLREIEQSFDENGVSISTLDFGFDEGTWTVTGNALQGVGGGAGQWYKIRHLTDVPVGFVASFTKTGNRGAFLFCLDSNYKGYMVYWTGTTVGVAEVDGDSTTDKCVLPCTETGAANVKVMVWPKSYTSVDEIDDLVVALWFDDDLLLTYTLSYVERGDEIGFGVYQSDTITFDDLVVPQLHHIVEWTSIDPGEPASSGLGRVIMHEKIRMLARYDGGVKAWRSTSTSADWTVPATRPTNAVRSRDIYFPTHIRLAGALHEIETFRAGTHGHIFTTGNDPNALSQEEVYDRAVRRHRETEETAEILTLDMAPNPIIEPEDLISYDSVTWRVNVIEFEIGVAGGTGYVLRSRIQAREYLAS